ncbi:Peroxisomal nicotinamide adenine dinucleotide carrier [Vitis vinifera]|uniref:Peroxisomal nicotinamide adenine dinucleotide carrier n=1 Tax=Vitis vinifera TaxID=29760 RepID=A0A438E0U4_VITVI|nr:Peroxisomal nicotinamide adenine dinucleotide carrier [Vitis vinifera]
MPCVNVLLTNPIWVIVTRMQLGLHVCFLGLIDNDFTLQTHTKISKQSKPIYSPAVAANEAAVSAIEPTPYGTSHAIQEVYGEAGVRGFWKGVLPTLIMVSNPSIQFMLYETMLKKLRKRRASQKKDSGGITASEIFLLGALAKLGATVVTYPLLVVKITSESIQPLDLLEGAAFEILWLGSND